MEMHLHLILPQLRQSKLWQSKLWQTPVGLNPSVGMLHVFKLFIKAINEIFKGFNYSVDFYIYITVCISCM